ncbi:MAG TPA: primosomal protein N' [Gemmatimonadota bacterium]|nr:primosomal protein N' [Gemmatimonadota bacterium]
MSSAGRREADRPDSPGAARSADAIPAPAGLRPPVSDLVDVALPLPLDRTFVYRVPEGVSPPPAGGRVVVGFGRRRVVGFAVGPVAAAPAGVRVRPLLEVVDREPVLSASEIALAGWIARYYVAPLGLVLRLFFPPGGTYAVAEGEAAAPARAPERLHVLPADAPPAGEDLDALARAPAQQAVWEAARRLPGPVEQAAFCRSAGVSPGAVRALALRGWIRVEPRPVDRDPYADAPLPEPAPEGPLTEAQATAVAAIREALTGEGGALLLEGVTGSGKTRVYVEAVAATLEAGGRAIVLVPEIGLAAPTVARFRARFGDRVAVLHSGLSDGERVGAWRRIREGLSPVVIGARSALFAPVGRAALVVVDEEHDAAYKQDETPRYWARDVAVYRAALEGAVAVLGSATPALETRTNADAGKYARRVLPARIRDRPLPPVEVVDLAAVEMVAPGLSRPLVEAMESALGAGDQTILFLNRRGFSAFLQCLDCGWVAGCPNCRISLTFHRAAPRLLCHYCAHAEPPPTACPECAGRELDHRGLGTQQVEDAVAARFPTARITRMDLDTTGPRGAHARIYSAMTAREIDVLVGTQMIAKGFDLPGVALVGVVSADTALHFPDFRSAERTFQLLVQVAGRAGRGDVPGRVLVQTWMPRHPVITAAAAHDYESFLRREMVERSGLGYPPARRLANVVVSGPEESAVEAGAERVAKRLRGRGARGVEVVGPAPCPLERLRGRARWHLLLKSESAAALEWTLWELVGAAERLVGSSARLEIDRDPLDLL